MIFTLGSRLRQFTPQTWGVGSNPVFMPNRMFWWLTSYPTSSMQPLSRLTADLVHLLLSPRECWCSPGNLDRWGSGESVLKVKSTTLTKVFQFFCFIVFVRFPVSRFFGGPVVSACLSTVRNSVHAVYRDAPTIWRIWMVWTVWIYIKRFHSCTSWKLGCPILFE